LFLFCLKQQTGIYHPNVQYTNFFCSPPIIHRSMNRSHSGDLLIEKLGKMINYMTDYLFI
jgi:hypothetical protein